MAIPKKDADDQANKYSKRRRNQFKKDGRVIAATSAGLLLLTFMFGLLLHVAQDAIEIKNQDEIAARKLRAAAMLSLKEGQHLNVESGEVNNRPVNVVKSLIRATTKMRENLRNALLRVDSDVRKNVHGGIHWVRSELLPPTVPDISHGKRSHAEDRANRKKRLIEKKEYFKSNRRHKAPMEWEKEWEVIKAESRASGDAAPPGALIDYTDKDKYRYPPVLVEPPVEGSYPEMSSLGELFSTWDQDVDNIGDITETLMHFDFTNPEELEMAVKFQDAGLPFKLVDVPEVLAAGIKWTDKYVSEQFSQSPIVRRQSGFPAPKGHAQESPNNFFTLFNRLKWDVDELGLPPARDSDWTIDKFLEHARYADATSLPFNQPHFHFQATTGRQELEKSYAQWTFISRDLPSFSSNKENIFALDPESRKGIHCGFEEKGVVMANHYDTGRNMIALVTGAKRYILSPPNQCSKLGIWTDPASPTYRRSNLNYAHLKHLKAGASGMPEEEREWLTQAAASQAVETVLKEGEVLFVPSNWFHYTVSLQKSAQCNVRSGPGEASGSVEHGSPNDVITCSE